MIPGCSANDLSSDVGIPSDAQGAADLIREGLTHGCDVGTFNDRFLPVSPYPTSFSPGECSGSTGTK